MEKPIIPYADWPNWVKLATATSTKLMTIKNPKIMMGLVGASFGVGICAILLPYTFASISEYQNPRQPTFDLLLLFAGLLNVLLGLYNLLVIAKAVAWVKDNSIWEERFSIRSSAKYKLQYFGIFIGIILVSYLLAIVLGPILY